jgi:hypothetical protein
MLVTPRRRFWLLCALVLPIANVAIISAQCPSGGNECPF